MVILTETEQAQATAYDRMTARQSDDIRQTDGVDIDPRAEHLNMMLSCHLAEIAFQGEEIGMLNRLKTTFRKNNRIVQLCDFHIRICNAIMEDASRDAERIRAEKKSCRV
jgi:hypothetical protein